MAKSCRLFACTFAPNKINFSFTLISASDLPCVRKIGRMKVYAKISVRDGDTEWQTTVDEVNGTNPKWNNNFNFVLTQKKDLVHLLDVKLYCQRTFGDNKYVGQVSIDLNKLFDDSLLENMDSHSMTVNVNAGGKIEFSYKFGDFKNGNVEFEKNKQSFCGGCCR